MTRIALLSNTDNLFKAVPYLPYSVLWRGGIDSCQGYRNKAFHYDLSCHMLRSSEKQGSVVT